MVITTDDLDPATMADDQNRMAVVFTMTDRDPGEVVEGRVQMVMKLTTDEQYPMEVQDRMEDQIPLAVVTIEAGLVQVVMEVILADLNPRAVGDDQDQVEAITTMKVQKLRVDHDPAARAISVVGQVQVVAEATVGYQDLMAVVDDQDQVVAEATMEK